MRKLLSPLLIAILATSTAGCADDDDGGSAGGADTGLDADATGGDASDDTTDLADDECPLPADHQLVLSVPGSDWTTSTDANDSLVTWNAEAVVDVSAEGINPGDTVSLTVEFDPPLTVVREQTAFDILFRSDGQSDFGAAYESPIAYGEGTLGIGPGPSGDFGLDDEGRISTVYATIISALPTEGETLSCASTRIVVPDTGVDRGDGSAVDVTDGGLLTFTEIFVGGSDFSGTSAEPFPWTFE